MTSPVDYVFLHGGGQGGWVWQETMTALHQQTGGKFARVLALDAPGCGEKRGRNTAGLDVDDVVTELLADISARGLKDVILVGHSQAGTMLPRLPFELTGASRRVNPGSAAHRPAAQTLVTTGGDLDSRGGIPKRERTSP